MITRLRRLTHSGGLVAAAFALKYPLIALPNIEPLTLAFFAVGYAYGVRWGAFVGALGMGIYASFNPLGPAIFPVWVSQLVGMSSVGMIGGMIGKWLRSGETARRRYWPVVLGGILATLFFDLVTNLAFALAIGPFWAVLVAGIPFAAIHIGSNALLFGLIFPILERWLLRPTTAVVQSRTS
jgi:hypothetical protein